MPETFAGGADTNGEDLETIPALEAIGTPTAPAGGETQEEVQGTDVFPPASHDNLVEDAFSRINSMPATGLDTEPIKGKFL